MTYEVLNGAYHITETIGSGGFAKVKLGYHLSTGDRVAIKIMNKKSLGNFVDRIKMEIETMKQLNHQNICKLYQVLETDEHFYLVLEHCQGGELFDYIVSKDRLSENDARACFRQITAAVAYLHHLGYAHRDLKPENLLLDEDQNIKLIDFGLCTMPLGVLSKTFCGSPAYAAPELISRTHYNGLKADMWSLGVLLYTLLCGFLPFNHENIAMLYKKIVLGKYDLPHWLSKESIELLSLLLHTDPHKRASISTVTRHPWLNKHYLETVQWRSKFASAKKHLEDDCITEMSVHYGLKRQVMREKVSSWLYDLCTATYLLLCRRKQQGRPVKLISLANVQYSPVSSLYLDDEFYDEDCGGDVWGDYRGAPRNCSKEGVASKANEKENQEPNLPVQTKFSEFLRPQTPKPKRRPVTIATTPDQHALSAVTPVHHRTPRPATMRPNYQDEMCKAADNALSPSRSYDSQINHLSAKKSTPNNRSHREAIKETSGLGRDRTPLRGRVVEVFGSLERGMDRIKDILTPKKKILKPRLAKTMNNVSNIRALPPSNYLSLLSQLLSTMPVTFNAKGFTLKCKSLDKELTFVLEIVRVGEGGLAGGTGGLMGVSRKRLKGSSWHYKHLCQRILSAL